MDNVVNGAGAHAELLGDVKAAVSALGHVPDGDDVFIGQASARVPVATRHRSVGDLVEMILGRCVPSQVAQSVVRRVAIVVASLHSFWARSYERFKHEALQAEHLLHARGCELDVTVIAAMHGHGALSTPMVPERKPCLVRLDARPDGAVISDYVTGKAGGWFVGNAFSLRVWGHSFHFTTRNTGLRKGAAL